MYTVETQDAWCKTCGYLLRGLPTAVCPERGRGFDLNDPKTYETRPPGWRRRRWIQRGLVTVGVIALLYAFVPRRILKGNITFSCAECGHVVNVERRELEQPRWIPFRYPGISWTSRPPKIESSAAGGTKACDVHPYNVAVRFDMHFGGWASGSGVFAVDALTINGFSTTPEAAGNVLRHLMHPANNGIALGP